jgi:hypothetical protein
MFRAIDEAIVAKIGQGRTQFVQLSYNADLEALAKPLAKGMHSPAWRVIDRRLQALRKASRIAYDRKAGWRVLPNDKAQISSEAR